MLAWEKNRKLIYTIGESKYYVAFANTRKDYKEILFWKGYYMTDIILERRVYLWFFGKQFLINEQTFKEKVPEYIQYTFEKFKADWQEFGKPKFVVIYIEQPHAYIEKTEEQRKKDRDTLTVMAGCNSGAY